MNMCVTSHGLSVVDMNKAVLKQETKKKKERKQKEEKKSFGFKIFKSLTLLALMRICP